MNYWNATKILMILEGDWSWTDIRFGIIGMHALKNIDISKVLWEGGGLACFPNSSFLMYFPCFSQWKTPRVGQLDRLRILSDNHVTFCVGICMGAQGYHTAREVVAIPTQAMIRLVVWDYVRGGIFAGLQFHEVVCFLHTPGLHSGINDFFRAFLNSIP